MANSNFIGELIKKQREIKQLKRSEVASKSGYSNLSKGSRKIAELERDGVIRPELLKKLIKILDINAEDYQSACQKQKSAFEQWLDEDVPMEMIVRYIPAVYVNNKLPADIHTFEDAIEYVNNFTRGNNLKVCLKLNRRWTYWACKGEGKLVETTFENPANKPYMSIAGRKFQIAAEFADE